MMDDENIAHSTLALVGAITFPGVIIIIATLAMSSESNTILVAGLLAIPGLAIGYIITKLYSLFVIKRVKKAGEDFDKSN